MLTLLVLALSARADDTAAITVTNDTTQVVTHVWLSEPDAEDYAIDLLESPIEPGASATVVALAGHWDLRVVNAAEAPVCDVRRYNVREGETFTITE